MCLCHHRSPVARDSSRAFASLSTFNFELLSSFSPTLSHTSEKSPASSKYCHTSKTPSRNSFTIRTSKTPLPQPLYNPHLQAPLGSAGNTGLITPLESALTENSPVTPVESALTKRWGWGRVGRNIRSNESQYAIGPASFSTSAVSTMTMAPHGQSSNLKGAKVQRPLSLNVPSGQGAACA